MNVGVLFMSDFLVQFGGIWCTLHNFRCLFIYLLNIFILGRPVTKSCILPWRPVDKIYIKLIAKQHVFIIRYKTY